ncbi:MAG: hypothetical protein EA401_13330 [Planctomycetota bacterium]|nr:MAG: hypothetical protein EA401_13330 [Planctomycetota bacterium]
MNASRATSHPLLWSLVLIAFVVIIAFYFRFWFQRGEAVGVTHPRPTGGAGVEVPDHAAFIARLDEDVLELGRQVYEANCVVCHGLDGMGGVNGARLFPTEEFRNGADPWSQYLTLSRGYNLMPAQPMLSTEEKHAVTHFVREQFLREQNPSQYTEITEEYLANGPWPAPGGADAEAPHPHGRNARKALTIPVKAVSAQFTVAVSLGPQDQWRQLVAGIPLSEAERQQWMGHHLSPWAARQLLTALADEDPDVFVQTAGDHLPPISLLPASRVRAIREQLLDQAPSSLDL